MNHATTTEQQTLDQAVKGLVIGTLTWLSLRYDLPAEVVVPGMVVVGAVMAWVSAKLGSDKGTASFVGPKSL